MNEKNVEIGGNDVRAKIAQLFKFGAIGGGAAVVYTIFAGWSLGHFTQFPKPLVSATCYGLMILPVYFLQHRFTFDNQASHKSALPKYVIVQLIAICLSFFFSYVVLHLFNFPNYIGSALVTGLTSIGSFFALKIWAFKKA